MLNGTAMTLPGELRDSFDQLILSLDKWSGATGITMSNALCGLLANGNQVCMCACVCVRMCFYFREGFVAMYRTVPSAMRAVFHGTETLHYYRQTVWGFVTRFTLLTLHHSVSPVQAVFYGAGTRRLTFGGFCLRFTLLT